MSKTTLYISSCGHVTYEHNTTSRSASGLVYYGNSRISCAGMAYVSSSASGNGASSWMSMDAGKSGDGNDTQKAGNWMSYATDNEEE